MPDISTVYQHVVGISFLDEQENNRVHKAWTERFRAHGAAWVRAEANENDFSVMQRIYNAITEAGREDMAGLSVVLAGFLDLRREDAGAQADLLKKLASRISSVGAVASLTIQFGFLGDIPSPDMDAQRECVKMISGKSIARLCLVAKNAFAKHGGNNWRAVIVLLDVLRRQPDPHSVLPYSGVEAQNVVGYLKYSEYNQKKRDKLLTEKNAIERALSDQGEMEFHVALTEYLNKMMKDAQESFPVNGASHPVHPGMSVEPGVLKINWVRAEAGNYAPYNDAVNHTVRAVEETVKRMRGHMMETFVPDAAEAREIIRNLLKESALGYRCIMNMLDRGGKLGVNLEPTSSPDMLKLPFRRGKNSTEAIHSYLVECRNYNAYLCKKALLTKLEEQFLLMADEFRNEIPVLEQQQKNVITQLTMVPDWQTYSSMVTGSGKRMESCFHPIMGGGDSKRFVLWREPEDGQDLNGMNPNVSYYIDKKYGNLKTIDDARSKAIHVFFDVCEQDTLMDLIK